ncbi:MAG: mycofactocin dehydrogenase MftG [Acidimicrobiales bacterium]
MDVGDESVEQQYDVIVVGAGSAGAALAARLSEDPTRSVLLIEAGPDYPDADSLPPDLREGNSAGPATVGPHVWGYFATANDQQPEPIGIPRGKVTGGSSAVNGSIMLRGMPEDFDDWAARGNPEWAFQRVLPFFCHMEDDLDFGGEFHGSAGPTPIQRHPVETMSPLQRAFFRAAEDAGFPVDPDMNAPGSTGVGAWPMNAIDGLRYSTALAYLTPTRHRSNLTILPNTLACRVLFDGRRATGMEVETDGHRRVVDGHEVVLSCGAIASPHLLLLSGVGPVGQLQQHGIEPVHDLIGVGENLRDHPLVVLLFRSADPSAKHVGQAVQAGLRCTADGSLTRNDLYLIPISVASGKGSAYSTSPDQVLGTGIGVALENPSTAGTLQLASGDPHDQPQFNYQYLSDAWDRERLRQGVRLAIELSRHPAYSPLLGERLMPCDNDLASDEALDLWMRTHATTQHHSSGTCKMGPRSDPTAVVDQCCRVHGLEGLRVVDASLMPNVVRANTNATAIMIGERVAAMMREGQ